MARNHAHDCTHKEKMYKSYCPKCEKEFIMQYRNDSTYCYCGLPIELVMVTPSDRSYWWTVYPYLT